MMAKASMSSGRGGLRALPFALLLLLAWATSSSGAAREPTILRPARPLNLLTRATATYLLPDGRRGEASSNPFDLPVPPAARRNLAPAEGESGLYIVATADRGRVSPGALVRYRILLENLAEEPLRPELELELPPGFRYCSGSFILGGESLPDPPRAGRRLLATLPTLAAGARTELNLHAAVTASARPGRAALKVEAGAGGRALPASEIRVDVDADDWRGEAVVMGRFILPDSAAAKPPAGVRVYLADGRYVLSDERGRFHLSGLAPGAHLLAVDPETLPPGWRLAPRERRHGGALRSLDLAAGSLWRVVWLLLPPEEGRAPAEAAPPALPVNALQGDCPDYGEAWLAAARPGVEWLWPPDGHLPAIASIKVAVKHGPTDSLELRLNGSEVNRLNLEGVFRGPGDRVRLSRWLGVDLAEGENRLELIVHHADGGVDSLARRVHVSRPPVTVELRPEYSRLLADGLNPPRVALRLTDEDGLPARRGTRGRFRVDPPYRSRARAESARRDPLLLNDHAAITFTVGEDGVALLELAPTSRAGEAAVHLDLVNGAREVRVWLSPGSREWFLLAQAEGALRWSATRGDTDTIGGDEGLTADGDLTFFAKGPLPGAGMLTLAYDGRGSDPGQPIGGEDDLESLYPLLGDAARVDREAASGDGLTVKLEHRSASLLYGDHPFQVSGSKLVRYRRDGRQLQGAWQGARTGGGVFLGASDQAFVREELPGEGGSGPYRLTRDDLLALSERICVEVRDRDRGERVLDRRELHRHLDYTIDYERGTLWFKEPVSVRDAEFNPVMLVVDYEVSDPMSGASYGGRGAWRPGFGFELGGSYLHEGGFGRAGDLGGADLLWRRDGFGELRVETAASARRELGEWLCGRADLLRWHRRGLRSELEFYREEREIDFGLGQERNVERGLRRTGGEARWFIDDRFALDAELERREDMEQGSRRDRAELRGSMRRGADRVELGLRHVEDLKSTGAQSSGQATFGLERRLLSERMRLRLDHEEALNGGRIAQPDRSRLGLEYLPGKNYTVFITEEFERSPEGRALRTRLGARLTPWREGSVSGYLGRRTLSDAERSGARLGVKQRLRPGKVWHLDLEGDWERGLEDDEQSKLVGFGVGRPLEGGAVSARMEWRGDARSERGTLMCGVHGELTPALGISVGARHTREIGLGPDSTGTAGPSSESELEFGLAHRPVGALTLIERLSLRREMKTGRTLAVDQRLAANLLLPGGRQLSTLLGFRGEELRLNGVNLRERHLLLSGEARQLVGVAWELGLRGALRRSLDGGPRESSWGLWVGRRIGEVLKLSLGYNFTGFVDEEAAIEESSMQGLELRVRVDLHRQSLGELARRF